MDQVDPLRREPFSKWARRRAWQVASITLTVLSVVLFIAVLISNLQRPRVSLVLLVAMTAAFCLFSLLLAKVLLQLRRDQRNAASVILGMSAKVTDGWSQRGLRTLLRVSPARLRYLIGNTMLRVRDTRITSSSLAALCEKNRPSTDPSTIERLTAAIAKDDAHSWERAAGLLGVTVTQVQNLISGSQLKLVDMFVTDRSFEEFCRKHGSEINTSLMDPATAKWLASEYGVSGSGNGRIVSRAQKHALVTRKCKCGRKIAGNVYFKHVKHCRPVEGPATRKVG